MGRGRHTFYAQKRLSSCIQTSLQQSSLLRNPKNPWTALSPLLNSSLGLSVTNRGKERGGGGKGGQMEDQGKKNKPAPRPLLYRVSTNWLSSRKGFSSVSDFQGNKVKRKELIFRGEELMIKPRIKF